MKFNFYTVELLLLLLLLLRCLKNDNENDNDNENENVNVIVNMIKKLNYVLFFMTIQNNLRSSTICCLFSGGM